MMIDEKLRFILCPLTVHLAKCMSKYLVIMANIRKEIDMGLSPTNSNLLFKTCKVDICKLFSPCQVCCQNPNSTTTQLNLT